MSLWRHLAALDGYSFELIPTVGRDKAVPAQIRFAFCYSLELKFQGH